MPFTFSPITDFQQLNLFLRNFTEYVNSFSKTITESYTGTGAQLEIHVGFRPELIIITTDPSLANIVFWYRSFPVPNSKDVVTGVLYTDAILGLAPKRDGFILGINAVVNTNGTIYRYIVIGT